MSLREILLAIQYMCIIGVFVESVVIVKRWKNYLHLYLLLSCIAALLNYVGYLLELTSGTKEEFITALKFSYIGRVWYAFFLFLFVAELTQAGVTKVLKCLFILIHAGTYGVILTIPNHRLYYTEMEIQKGGMFLKFAHENGIVHHLHMSLQMLYILTGIYWLIRAYHKERSGRSRKRLLTVLVAMLTESIFFIVQMVGIPGLTEYYDVTMLGYFFGTILMFVAIFSFDLLGTTDIAKEFVIDRISEGIIAVDNDGVVQYYNAPAAKLYPILGSEGSDTTELLSNITKTVKEGTTINIRDRIYTPKEDNLLYDGESLGKLYALMDDTEHYRYMEELEKQKEIADNANEAKTRFLANMSHEIRTPINAVLGFDEMILRETKEKSIRAYAADIMSAGKTLLSLINDILDLSKVEAGKMEIIPAQYELSSLINDLNNMIKDRAAKKGLKFLVDVNAHIPHLLIGDEIRIRQCVMNLLTNAVKYTEKGSVTMRLDFSEVKDDEICRTTEEARAGQTETGSHIYLIFSVEDTGIGMKQEDMEKLFSPYKRIEEKRNRQVEGTGLGMGITRGLLELMGSSLDVHSEYGKGTKVSFAVSQEVVSRDEIGDYAHRLDEANSGEAVYRALFHAPNAHILVVDDTEINLTVIQNLLKETKICIDIALSGKDAIALATSNEYDVAFIDHMMPDMDGIETLTAFRNTEKNRKTPTVALTANAISGARQMYLDAGFTDYLSKPVDGTKLERMLLGLLPKEKIEKPSTPLVLKQREKRTIDLYHYQQSSEEEAEQQRKLPDFIYELPDIDAEVGMKNCGTADGYLSVLTVFHQTADTKAEEIDKLYREGEIENYTIKVHALKSSAGIIGAGKLSRLAEELENAGKKNDVDFIKEHTKHLLMMYRSLDRGLVALDGEDRELPDIGLDALEEAYQTIIEITKSMDYGLMIGILDELKNYNKPTADKENIRKIEKMLNALDWEGISETASKAIRNMEDSNGE